MLKHDNECYWDCICRRFPTASGELLSGPDDDCEPLHYLHIGLLKDIQEIVDLIQTQSENDYMIEKQYVLDLLINSLKKAQQ